MPLLPIVRYMLPYEDCRVEPGHERRVTIVGLVSNIVALDDPPYPVLCRELCVFLALTEGRGSGEAKLICRFEESGEIVFESPGRRILWSTDPLEVTMLLFRLADCPFPFPGVYQLQFCYNGTAVAERPLRLR